MGDFQLVGQESRVKKKRDLLLSIRSETLLRLNAAIFGTFKTWTGCGVRRHRLCLQEKLRACTIRRRLGRGFWLRPIAL